MIVNIQGVNITLTGDQVKQLEKAKIPTPEVRLLELLNDLTIKIDKEKYPDSIFFFRGDECWMELKNSTVLCQWGTIWSIFENEYNMQYSEVQNLIKSALEEHFKIKDVTPIFPVGPKNVPLEEHFKIKDVTPSRFVYREHGTLEEHFKNDQLKTKSHEVEEIQWEGEKEAKAIREWLKETDAWSLDKLRQVKAFANSITT